MVVDPPEHVREVVVWIEAAEFGRLDQRHGISNDLAAGIGAREQKILSADHNLLVILPMSGRK